MIREVIAPQAAGLRFTKYFIVCDDNSTVSISSLAEKCVERVAPSMCNMFSAKYVGYSLLNVLQSKIVNLLSYHCVFRFRHGGDADVGGEAVKNHL